MARKFGIITSVENLQAGIVVNGITRNESAEIAEARNEKGQITDLAAYSRAESISVQGVIDDAKGKGAPQGGRMMPPPNRMQPQQGRQPVARMSFAPRNQG